MLNRLIREPVIQFLAAGALIFAVHALLAPDSLRRDRIHIPAQTVSALATQHARLWGRPPTREELDRLVEARVLDEILYREGMAMGLDRDDAVIQRRVRQKYELIAEEEDELPPPDDAELAKFLATNRARFERPPAVTYRQVMVDEKDAARTLAKLQAGGDPLSVGIPGLLPAGATAAPVDLVARDFGQQFAAALLQAQIGPWQGPVQSSYGTHLVQVSARQKGELPQLEDIRPQVVREWENAQRARAREERIARLRRKFEIDIEWPGR